MKINCVKLKNFRSYREETRIDFGDMTAFVGKNDAGKSTVLEALDIFFNDGKEAVKIEKEDVNVQASCEGDNETVISVCFSELPDNVVIDADTGTSLADEYMLNSEGLLEVVKRYKNGGKASVFIRANHPVNPECCDLLLKKGAELRKLIKEAGIDSSSLKINSEMRKALRSFYADKIVLEETEIDASKEDARKIWEKLEAYMPTYSLFRSDRENSDGDSEVQDPLREAVRQMLKEEELKAELADIAERILNRLKEVSDKTLEKLREIDSEAAGSLTPNISHEKLKWLDVFKNISISGDENIPVRKRGSGIKRLVLLSFFRAEAERKAEEENSTGIIYAIEEPETSQHPNNQRIMIKALKALAQKNNIQVIITTHSPAIVKELDFEDIRLIVRDKDTKHIRRIEPSALAFPSLNEINYLAYGEAAEEYHNELYGFIEENQWLNNYKSGRPVILYWQFSNQTRKYTEKHYTLTEYVRNQIHHPENHRKRHFTPENLRQSIEDMRTYILTRKSNAETIS